MTAAVLAALAVLHAGPLPSLLARTPAIRRAPRAAVALWQAIALAAVLAALGAGLVTVTAAGLGPGHGLLDRSVAVAALLLTLVVMGRLLLTGHLVGTRLRAVRRRHRALVDLVAARDAALEPSVLVLEDSAPVAYCLPGIVSGRVVISRGAETALEPEELRAVVAHERAHLAARHDLVLEAFTVLHDAFPRFVAGARALAEVRLLVEVLADAAARRKHGALPLARALVALAGTAAPDAALAIGAGSGSPDLRARITLLADERPHRVVSAALYAAAAAVLALPGVVVSYPWLAPLLGS